MNERILPLAKQAGFENGHQDRNGNSLSYELEKFAELIIRECCLLTEQYQHRVTFDCADETIKKHFGVEQ